MDTNSNEWPEIYPGRTMVCPPESHDANNLKNKIARAFDNVKSFPLKRILIQFWRAKATPAGKKVLTCSGYPYALSRANDRLLKYRSACVTYYYGLHADIGNDPRVIHRAPAAYAALGHFSQLVMDISVYQGTITHPNPLLDLALECDLTCFMMLPVFNHDHLVGVIEVSMRRLPGDLVVIFNELHSHVMNMGLSFCPPPRLCLPSPPIFGDLVPATCECLRALSAAARSHGITLAHVWVPFKKPHSRPHVRLTRPYLVRSCSFSACHGRTSFVRLLYQNLRLLPLDMVQVLVRRALETHRPHLCRNIHGLMRDHRGMLALLSANTESYTSFVICLRSSHTGEQDYVFEFFWPQTSNHLAMMEDLLSTLRKNLPSFKYASGAQLGDELHVVDTDSSPSASGITIFPGNKLSETPNAERASARLKRKF